MRWPLQFPMMLLLLLALPLSGCLQSPTIPSVTTPPVALAPALSFAKEVLIDPNHRGGEPSITVDSHNHYYVSAPSGLVTTVINSVLDPTLAPKMGPQNRQSFIWKSEDSGTSWRLLTLTPPPLPPLRGDATFGGGDTDLAVDACDTVYFSDLWLGNIAVSHSDDGGKTWTGVPVTGRQTPLDRQWLATDGCGVVYLAYQTFLGQVYVLKSTDKGMTFPQQTLVTDGGYTIDGNVIVDSSNHNVYLVMGAADGKGTLVATSTDGGQTFQIVQSSKTEGDINNIFPVIANDHAGNLYVVWSENHGGSYNVYLVRSSDHGKTWTAPLVLSGPEGTGTEVFPWVTAGAPGHVAVAWIAAPDTVAKTDDVKGDWYVYLTATTNGHQDSSTWTTVRMSDKPMHQGDICTAGLYCTLPQPVGSRGNRNLADFFEIGLDREGHVVATWPDDYETAKDSISLPYFGKQVSGFNFLDQDITGHNHE